MLRRLPVWPRAVLHLDDSVYLSATGEESFCHSLDSASMSALTVHPFLRRALIGLRSWSFAAANEEKETQQEDSMKYLL